MLTLLGKPGKANCGGLRRRDFLAAGSLGLAGLSLPELLRKRAEAKPGETDKSEKAVILFWLNGGLSHFESFDPKPNLSAGQRGPFGSTETVVPGIRICDRLPRHTQVMDKVSILRSVHHKMSGHWGGPHAMLTGFSGPTFENPAQSHPSAGSIVAKARGPNRPGALPYVSIPFAYNSFEQLSPGYHSASYLGVENNPFDVTREQTGAALKAYAFQGGKEFIPRNFQITEGMTLERMNDRRGLLKSIDSLRREIDTSGTIDAMDKFNQQAFEITLGSGCRDAFDLSGEDPRLRDRYGRDILGQSALLARRLTEAGVTFVTICYGDWDHHEQLERLMTSDLHHLDQAMGTLIADLDQRGMLDNVLVLAMGEFGRTPKFNDKAGRDHWPDAASVLIGGGGLRGGQVVGSTNDKGEQPLDRPLVPADVLATLYHTMGINLGTHFEDRSGRPVPINNNGAVIHELI